MQKQSAGFGKKIFAKQRRRFVRAEVDDSAPVAVKKDACRLLFVNNFPAAGYLKNGRGFRQIANKNVFLRKPLLGWLVYKMQKTVDK